MNKQRAINSFFFILQEDNKLERALSPDQMKECMDGINSVADLYILYGAIPGSLKPPGAEMTTTTTTTTQVRH